MQPAVSPHLSISWWIDKNNPIVFKTGYLVYNEVMFYYLVEPCNCWTVRSVSLCSFKIFASLLQRAFCYIKLSNPVQQPCVTKTPIIVELLMTVMKRLTLWKKSNPLQNFLCFKYNHCSSRTLSACLYFYSNNKLQRNTHIVHYQSKIITFVVMDNTQRRPLRRP